MTESPVPSDPPPIEQLAIHEAAHAVAHIALRQRPAFEYVSISPDEDSWGHLRSHALPDSTFEDKPRQLNSEFLTIFCEVMIFLAGDIAESKLRQEEATLGSSPDVQKARKLAIICVCSNDTEASKFIEWAFEKSKNLVTSPPNWFRIQILAKELMSLDRQKGKSREAKMSYRKVKRIYDTALARYDPSQRP